MGHDTTVSDEMGVESIAIRPMKSKELCIIDDEVLAAHLSNSTTSRHR